MKSHYLKLIFFLILIFSNEKSFSCIPIYGNNFDIIPERFNTSSLKIANMANQKKWGDGRIPKLGGDDPCSPFNPKSDLEWPIAHFRVPPPSPSKKTKEYTEYVFIDKEVLADIKVKFDSQNVPSCKVVKNAFNELQIQNQEINKLIDRMNNEELLTSSEIKELVKFSQSITQSHELFNNKVYLSVEWKFVEGNSDLYNSYKSTTRIETPFYFEKYNTIYTQYNSSNFKNFFVKGPGIQWEKKSEFLPPFFELVFRKTINLSYQMSLMDFCFSEPIIYLQGKMNNELSDNDPVLVARWERDTRKTQHLDLFVIKLASFHKEQNEQNFIENE